MLNQIYNSCGEEPMCPEEKVGRMPEKKVVSPKKTQKYQKDTLIRVCERGLTVKKLFPYYAQFYAQTRGFLVVGMENAA